MEISESFSPGERFNILVSGLRERESFSWESLSTWIDRINTAFDSINNDELLEKINENRLIAGFPQVEILWLEEISQERRNWCRQVIKSRLNELTPKQLVQTVTEVVDMTTDNGEKHASGIIDDLVDFYEVEAQEFFRRETENIKQLLATIRSYAENGKPESALSFLTEKLVSVVENWDFVAQPIQVSMKSKGLLHEPSKNLGYEIRDLSIFLFNRHEKLELTRKINELLQKVFAEVVQVAEKTEEDAKALQEIEKNREEWKKEISYETKIGHFLSKYTFRISAESLFWEGSHWNLSKITRLRWGGVITTSSDFSHFPVNISKSFSIYWGDEHRLASLETSDEGINDAIVERLWKTVGVRLYLEMLNGLKEGKKFYFRGVQLFDTGMVIPKNSVLNATLEECSWSEIKIWNKNGAFCIEKKDNEQVFASLAYLEVDNVHILEFAIRALFKTSNNRMSSLLKV